jgi:outer membrane lipoprotein SlyB
MKGAAVVGVAVLAYDFVSTGHQVVRLESQGNATGAESARTHFVGRNVGGIGGGIAGGFLAGAGYGALTGSWTGPGAIITSGIGGIGGGIIGGFAGEKWAQQKDIERVFTQKDKDGNEWSRDPNDPNSSWTRMSETQNVRSGSGGSPTFSNVRYVAGDVLANELNYKSANASYELGLANLSTPQNPYSIPLGNADTPGKYGGSESRYQTVVAAGE